MTMRGFSLIELIIAIGVVAILMLAGTAFVAYTTRLPNETLTTLEHERNARQTLERMTDEVRRMATSNRGDYPIGEATATTLVIYTNVNDDTLLERVRYFLDGSTLKRGVIKPTGAPLTYDPATETINELTRSMANGTTPIFTYFDTNYSGSEPPLALPVRVSDIRYIHFTLTIDENPNASPPPLIVESGVTPRVLKDNL